jgi:hypothetical protein
MPTSAHVIAKRHHKWQTPMKDKGKREKGGRKKKAQ